MKDIQLKRILEDIADYAVREDANLWPVIRSKFESSKPRTRTGESVMKENLESNRWLRKSVVIAITILVAAMVLVTTPQGQAWAQTVWRFFSPESSDVRAVATVEPTLVEVSVDDPPEPLPTITAEPARRLPFQEECGSLVYAHCSLAEIQGMVDFPVFELAELTDDYEFIGATGGPDQVMVQYRNEAGTLVLSQQRESMTELFSWPVGSSATIEPVDIGYSAGEYVQGTWVNAMDAAGSVQWNPDVPARNLRWQTDGFIYTLQFTPAKTDEGIEPNKSMMIEFATGANPVVVAEDAEPVQPVVNEVEVDLKAVEAVAGFAINVPTWIPDQYALVDANYAPTYGAVCQYYRWGDNQGSPSLVIAQSPYLLSLGEIMMAPQEVNGVEIEIPIFTETPDVGGADGVQTMYASNGIEFNTLCEKKDLIINHALIWQSNDMSYIIGARLDDFTGRGFLSQFGMQRMAESLTGISTLGESELDPGYLTSIEDVETLAEFDVKTPSQMPSDVHFTYAAVQKYTSELDQDASRVIQVYFTPERDSIQRHYGYLFFVYDNPDNTLEEWGMGGGDWVNVNDLPAVYSESCWESPSTGETNCTSTLTWDDEEGMRYNMVAFLPGALEKEHFLAIAESMQ